MRLHESLNFDKKDVIRVICLTFIHSAFNSFIHLLMFFEFNNTMPLAWPIPKLE